MRLVLETGVNPIAMTHTKYSGRPPVRLPSSRAPRNNSGGTILGKRRKFNCYDPSGVIYRVPGRMIGRCCPQTSFPLSCYPRPRLVIGLFGFPSSGRQVSPVGTRAFLGQRKLSIGSVPRRRYNCSPRNSCFRNCRSFSKMHTPSGN